MRRRALCLWALVGLPACMDTHSSPADIDPTLIDGGASDAPYEGLVDLAPTADRPRADGGPYGRTIVIDGKNDFDTTKEGFATTSTGFTAYVSWDATKLYFGYSGSDVKSGDAAKWIHLFIDVDPAASKGATAGESYGGQQASFSGVTLRPDYYFRWKMDNSFQDVRAHKGSNAWDASTIQPTTFQQGEFIETSLPLGSLGSPKQLGLVSYMLNEASGAEWVWAGLYAANFVDGKHAQIPLSKWLLADLSTALTPNDPKRMQ